MRIAVIGGGPGGLYFSALAQQLGDRQHDITVWERNAADDTFGFGVVFSDATMAGIADADSEAFRGLSQHLVHWDDIEVHYRGERITSTGHGFSGMSRHTLLNVMQQQALTAQNELQKNQFQAQGDSIKAAGRAKAILAELKNTENVTPEKTKSSPKRKP